MKRLTICTVSLALLFSVSACSNSPTSSADTTKAQETAVQTHHAEDIVSDWETSLAYLTDGNARYVNNESIVRDSNDADRTTLAEGQHPFAVIVTCADSRVSPEIYFDQKLGDIFVIRNAGNIIDETTLGSIEYAVEHLGVPLVVVMGHTSCGAVTGAFEGGEYPHNLQSIINTITQSIKSVGNLDDAIEANIESGVEKIKEDETIEEIGTTVLGACYDIETGEVAWHK